MDRHTTDTDSDAFMEDLGETLGYVKAYASQEIESAKLEIAEKISIASSSFITGLVLTGLGSFALLFAFIALAFYLGGLLNSDALGFLIVAGFFFIMLFFVFLFRKTLITDKIVTAVIHLIFNKKYNDED